MHRFFVPPDRCSVPEFALGEAEARHAHQVLRLGRGDRLEVLDGQGTLVEAEIVSAGRGGVEVRSLARHVRPRAAHRLVLLQSLLKGKALDMVLEKSVELGVDRVILVETERCVARVPSAEAERKRGVWTQTLVEAAKQSRNPWLPELLGPLPLDRALGSLGSPLETTLLFASLEAGTPPLGSVLGSQERPIPPESSGPAGSPAQRDWAVAVGPEGDFSPAELDRLRHHPGIGVSLGPLILRAETATIAAVAILADSLRRHGATPRPANPSPIPVTPTA